MNQKYNEIVEKLSEQKVRKNVSLAEYTTFKIGGSADLFCEAENSEDLIRVIRPIREVGIPYLILGEGSNILAGDRGFRGIVIKVKSSKFKSLSRASRGIQSYSSKFKVFADAGVCISTLIRECVKNSMAGLEFMAGIPGTVGGAVRGNAGAWQQSFGEFINKVKVLTEDLEVKWLSKEECQFGYRESRFKYNQEVILEVELIMERGEKKEIERKIKEYLEKRACQPKEPSAGCIFINPKPQSAGELIEKCGLKGKQIGGARISERHANFIVNDGNASASDVVQLIELVKSSVKEKFNIDLKEEIVRAGEF